MTRLNVQWKSASGEFRIDRNTVHVWRAYLQPALASERKFVDSLSQGEIERAKRFIRQSDRDRYIFAHGLLRSILGGYVG